MSVFSETQIQDLGELQSASLALGAEVVIVGAMAYRLFFTDDVGRETYDIDLAVALDLDKFGKLEEALAGMRWTQRKMQEQGCHSPRESFRPDTRWPIASQTGKAGLAAEWTCHEFGRI